MGELGDAIGDAGGGEVDETGADFDDYKEV